MKKILFRDFVAHYMSSVEPLKKAEPLVITISTESRNSRLAL